MEGNTFVNRRSALLGFATFVEEKFLQYIAVLLACVSLKYLNTGTNLPNDNAVAWHAFLVALLFAAMAWCKMKLASRNASEVPITSNQITPPISNFTACIFLLPAFLAIFSLSFVLHPFHGWLISLCLPLFLFDEIPHSSYYYDKAVEGLAAISNRVFILPAPLQQIFRGLQQGRSSPEASNDMPQTAV